MAVTADELRSAFESEEELNNKQKKAVLSHVNKLFNTARNERVPFERDWYTNLAYYFGRHYVQWKTAQALGNWQRLWEPPAPPWRVRLVANRIRPIIRKELAKLTKEKPRGYVVPNTTEEDDLAGARAGEAVNDQIWRELKVDRTLRRALFWTLITGTSFIKDWYDPDDIDFSGMEGAIKTEPVTPFHLYVPDIAEEELENQDFVVHAIAKGTDWIDRNFDVKVASDSASSGILEQKFLGALGIKNKPKSDKVIVKEAWIRSSKMFPDGAVVLWAGDEVLNVTEGFEYNHREYPFTKLEHIPTGRFYGESVIKDLIPLQREYNRTRSQIVEAKNRMAKPQLVAAKGSVDPRKITSEPGLIIFYQPGFQPPQPLPLQSLPGYVIEELERIRIDMDDISAQHEIARGSVPPGVTAATAISFLQEEDDTTLSHTVSSIEDGVERISRHFLSHVNQYWEAERTIRVVGENGQYEAFLFSAKNVNDNTDYRVEAGSATPRSRAAKQAFIMELGKMGWITPDKALRYVDMGEVARLYEEMQKDARQAQRENLTMSALAVQFQEQIQQMDEQQRMQLMGNPKAFQEAIPKLPINAWDNHLSHHEEHTAYMKSQAFENLGPVAKQVFMDHDERHKVEFALSLGVQLPPGDPRLNAVIQGLGAPGGESENGGPSSEGNAPEEGPPV